MKTSVENLKCANFLIPDELEIIAEGSAFSEENDQWIPTYKIVYPDGHKSGGLPSICEAIVMARNEWAEYCHAYFRFYKFRMTRQDDDSLVVSGFWSVLKSDNQMEALEELSMVECRKRDGDLTVFHFDIEERADV